MKKVSVLIAICMLAVCQSAVGQANPGIGDSSVCSYQREAMLALDEASFDQDPEGGWRAVARQAGCRAAAADLIRDYRESNDLRSNILYWHEGQLRAYAGEIESALRLFESSRGDANDSVAWNLYVDATIAFLRQNRDALLNARETLAALPEPETTLHIDAFGNEIDPPPWPPNLSVVDRLIQCFGRPYREAYARCEQ